MITDRIYMFFCFFSKRIKTSYYIWISSIAAVDEAVASSYSFGHSLTTDDASAIRCLIFDAPYHWERKLQSFSTFPESPPRRSHLPGERGQCRV